MTPKPRRTPDRADVLVVGDGVIGLSVALAVARGGAIVRVIGTTIEGRASAASAGLLAPSLGACDDHVRELMRASRDLYPQWVRWLAERTGIEVPLNLLGILEIDPESAAHSGAADQSADPDALRLDQGDAHALEPALVATARGVLHPEDGYVDNVTLVDALREAVRCEWSIDFVEGRGASMNARRDGCSVTTEDGRILEGGSVVLAAGAWSALVAGLPRAISVEPVRGQMLMLDGCPLTHAVAAPGGYLVPRGDRTLVGSTLERVGFDSRTTSAALEHLRRAAVAVVPELEASPVVDAWAGLRPMTPDALPILGRDPDFPTLVYACGHGKNGILLAPSTADCTAAILAGARPPFDVEPYSVDRFD